MSVMSYTEKRKTEWQKLDETFQVKRIGPGIGLCISFRGNMPQCSYRTVLEEDFDLPHSLLLAYVSVESVSASF